MCFIKAKALNHALQLPNSNALRFIRRFVMDYDWYTNYLMFHMSICPPPCKGTRVIRQPASDVLRSIRQYVQ